MTLPTASILAVSLGTVLIVLGLRGRRCALHRMCHHCGYDLTGQPGESAKCPECGSDLTVMRAVCYADRTSIKRLVVVGSSILALTGVYLGTLGVRRLDRVDWQSLKPAGQLVFEAHSSDTARREAALDELLDRADGGILSSDRLRSMALKGLEFQSDPSVSWEPRWGSVVEQAIARGLLTTEQKHDYLEGAINFSVVLQHARGWERTLRQNAAARQERPSSDEGPVLARYELAEVDLAAAFSRTGQGTRLTIDVTPMELSIGDWSCPGVYDGLRREFTIGNITGQSIQKSLRQLLRVPIVVDPGSYAVTTRCRVGLRFEDEPVSAALTRDLKFETSIVVEPPGEHAVPIVTNTASSERLKNAFDAYAIGFRKHEIRRAPDPVTIIYMSVTTGAGQALNDSDELAPFNGALHIEVSHNGTRIGDMGPHLPGGWSGMVVADDTIDVIDLEVHYSQSSLAVTVGPNLMAGQGPAQPIWMGPPFEIKNLHVTWYDTIDDAPLSADERGSIEFSQPLRTEPP